MGRYYLFLQGGPISVENFVTRITRHLRYKTFSFLHHWRRWKLSKSVAIWKPFSDQSNI